MATDKPIFLLVHGSWHKPHLYQPLEQALAARGFALIIPTLPTMGQTATGVGWDADVELVLEQANALFAEGKEVVLIGHSYGGIPACIATRGNGAAERRAVGLPGGFCHIIFLCAFVMPAVGFSLSSLISGRFPEWQEVSESQDKKQLIVNGKARDALFNDLPPERAQAYFDDLVPQSFAAVVQPVDFAVPDITIPKTYIVCENDQAFPASLQRKRLAQAGLREVSVSGGHSAFSSVPVELADLLVQIATNR
ncbi:alpha/beta-hydrolase [Ustulina deusta]|nr:alpha/beta-hydrolase [Ustulina deusta]KAI3340073.1 alpha/beta-hydrolase [Ustulina deusta]